MTTVATLRPAVAVSIPAFAALAVLVFRRRPTVREGWTLLAATATLAVVASLVPGALAGTPETTRLGAYLVGTPLALRADALGVLFALLASALWLATSVYSIGYVRALDEHAQARYFAAFAASIAATLGVALAANLLTLFVAYELLTVATYPLVVHAETDEARRAGRTYLAYTFAGGVAVFAGIVLVAVVAGDVGFTPGGVVALATADPVLAQVAFALLVGGFGVKAALMPLHGWLPAAMVAPTPVSGLLHAVAVVKSGVFGIARVVLFVFGPEAVRDLGVALPLALVAAATMLLAGVLALRQDNLKRGVAYSTVSQLSYIVLGVAVLTPRAAFGATFHVVAHAVLKLTVFLCVGALAVEADVKYVSQVPGVGRRMPVTMAAFGVAAAGLVGLPLVAGFVSKWYLALGTLAGAWPVLAVAFWVAGLLKLLYFWPIVGAAFVPGWTDRFPAGPLYPAQSDSTTDGGRQEGDSGRSEAPWLLLGPILAVVGLAVLLGVRPSLLPFFDLAQTVVTEVFG